MSDKQQGILLKEVQLYWASLKEPKVEEGRAKYVADITNLTREQAMQLHEAGVEVRKGEDLKTPQPDKGLFVTARSGIQPRIVNALNQKLDGDAVPEVGNGTLANVFIRPYEWDYKGKSGVSAGLNGVQILKLVQYETEADVFSEEPAFASAANEADDVPF